MEREHNRKKPITPFLFLITASCVCALLYLYALPNSITWLIELSNRGLLIMWIIGGGYVLFRQVIESVPKTVASTLVLAGFTLAALAIALLLQRTDAFSKTMSVFGFLAFPFMLCYSAFFKIDDRAKRAVCFFAICCSFVFIDLYYSDYRQYYEGPYGGVELDVVTLGYANPNQTAIYLFSCATVLFTSVFYFKSNLFRLLVFLDGCYISWILFQTESRTAMAMLVVFGVFIFLLRGKSVSKRLVDIAILTPVIYLVFFVVLALLQKSVTFLNVDIFNGRDVLYSNYLNRLTFLTALFGDLNRYMFQNMHNGYVAIAASAGVVSCFAYAFCLRACAMGNRPAKDAPAYMRVSFIAFLCMIMYTASEAAYFVGGSVYGFLMFAPVVMFATPYARQNIKAEET